jgi:peptidoglycan/xylan/chitin deacetylase (PgdA/CDA1 family)
MSSCAVLMYHVVDGPGSAREKRLCCDPGQFAAQMDYLARNGYSVVPLQRLVASLQGTDVLPSKAVAITFDDGFSCLCENALPVLATHGFPATVFMIAGLIGRSNEWQQETGTVVRRMLSAEQLRILAAAAIDIGSHTVNHPHLAKIPLAEARAEVRDSKSRLEDVLGRAVPHFAFPYGSFSPQVRDEVIAAGYVAACSTRWGKRHSIDDLFSLRRVEIQGSDSLLTFAMKLHIATNHMPPIPEARQLVRQTLNRAGLLSPRLPGGI